MLRLVRHRHHATFFVTSSTTSITGRNSLPRWLPSQNGAFFVRPQAQIA